MSPLSRLFAGTAAMVAVYFAVPIQADRDLVLRAVLTALGVLLATWLIVRQVVHQMRQERSPLWTLGLAVVGGVLVFALADYIVADTAPGEFVGLHTRLDALYFALTTLATVGYGDVHGEGQVARAVVSLQLVFNLIVLTTAASVLARQVRARTKRSTGG